MGAVSPVVFILGSTGTGKTKLSLELAKKFGGEIIGADSMQIYKGLDIITAKATKSEQNVAPHYMIDILEPHERFTVLNFRNKALDIINQILFEKKKLPIIVGGTNYYIESLIWKVLIEKDNAKSNLQPGELPNNEHTLSSEELHKKLKTLDPESAKRLHPNNKRKIIRALEVYHQTGKKLSEILIEQQSEEGASSTGGGLRFPNALVFWLQCDQKVLDTRLYERVNSMVEQGLVQELTNFHKLYNENRVKDDEVDYTKGVFQSIGFKEFHSYLMLTETERNTPEGEKKLLEGIELLKIATRQYARKQTRWTSNRFLGRKDRKAPPTYGLDTTDVSKWNENVTQPAVKIIECAISGAACDISPLTPQETGSISNILDETHFCETCDKVFVGSHQWQKHINSVKHRKVIQSKKKFKSQ